MSGFLFDTKFVVVAQISMKNVVNVMIVWKVNIFLKIAQVVHEYPLSTLLKRKTCESVNI